jgi:uncharacterized protein YutE (UPF0331/DUF86 family)
LIDLIAEINKMFDQYEAIMTNEEFWIDTSKNADELNKLKKIRNKIICQYEQMAPGKIQDVFQEAFHTYGHL